jgi:hypothetical protein
MARRFHIYHWRSPLSVSITYCAVPVAPRFRIHWIDAASSDLRLEVEDHDKLFSSVLTATGGGVAVDSAGWRTFGQFALVCAIQ